MKDCKLEIGDSVYRVEIVEVRGGGMNALVRSGAVTGVTPCGFWSDLTGNDGEVTWNSFVSARVSKSKNEAIDCALVVYRKAVIRANKQIVAMGLRLRAVEELCNEVTK